MNTIAKCKDAARSHLPGSYQVLAISSLLLSALPFCLTAAFYRQGPGQSRLSYLIALLIITILSDVLKIGFYHQCLELLQDKRPQVTDLFFAFSHNADKAIIVSFLRLLLYLLVSIPFLLIGQFAPGFFRYTWFPYVYDLLWAAVLLYVYLNTVLSFFLYLEMPEKNAADLLRESRAIMNGHCLQLFFLFLSFAGYILLCLLSFGIGFLWIRPYMTVSLSQFYQDRRTAPETSASEELYSSQGLSE